MKTSGTSDVDELPGVATAFQTGMNGTGTPRFPEEDVELAEAPRFPVEDVEL